MWRPEDGEAWRGKRADYLNRNTLLAISIENKATYEAGADAMLEALFKAGFALIDISRLKELSETQIE